MAKAKKGQFKPQKAPKPRKPVETDDEAVEESSDCESSDSDYDVDSESQD